MYWCLSWVCNHTSMMCGVGIHGGDDFQHSSLGVKTACTLSRRKMTNHPAFGLCQEREQEQERRERGTEGAQPLATLYRSTALYFFMIALDCRAACWCSCWNPICEQPAPEYFRIKQYQVVRSLESTGRPSPPRVHPTNGNTDKDCCAASTVVASVPTVLDEAHALSP